MSFLKYMREEIKFSNLYLLIDQMNMDKQNAKVFFRMED
ncbi:riboflavin kinase [Bacillus massiliigorillae]